ncbi:unnamed protein product [Rotaria sordida]|uniref:Uncharacterized protein n=1 Tax=Rotaria sordida TaxID=392033 RepID=A0A815YVV6_9BILA|nr:unnamed protein product [Rotaria sordida]CAF1575290.1 unnamed protein product [Rotaria sordida]
MINNKTDKYSCSNLSLSAIVPASLQSNKIDGKETDYSVPIQDHLSEDKLINTADLVDNIEDEIKKSVRKYRRTNRATTTANRAERQ